MPADLSGENFQIEFCQAVEAAIGPDWRTRTNAELLRRTGLSVSEETLRKIRMDGHIPSERIQQRILDQLRGEPSDTAMQYTESNLARDEVRALMGVGVVEVPVGQDDPRLPCDLVLEDQGLGLGCYIVRCLDDSRGELPVTAKYLSDTISQLARTMDRFRATQGVIITHRRLAHDSVEQANRAGIKLRNYDNFVESRFSSVRFRETIDRMRVEREITDRTYISLPAERITRSGITKGYALDFLADHLSGAPGSATAAILGSFGTGKTSTMLTVAYRLLTGDLTDNEWALPLWIDAASLSINVEETLQGAMTRFSPDTPLPMTSIKKLIGRGRLWLFVDALDEALALRRPDDLRHLISKYVELIHPAGRLIFSARQEMFDSVAQELGLFDEQLKSAEVDNTLVLRLGRMSPEEAISAIRARLPQERANRVVGRIESDNDLNDLVTRPIFMHIAAQAATVPLAEASGSGVAALFEAYVQQWSYREEVFSPAARMPPEDRLRACELLALSYMILGQKPGGFSVYDLSDFANSNLASGLGIQNIDLFVYEARIAMFLERRSDDHFDFAHQCMREFFLARRAAREIKDAAQSLTAPEDMFAAPYFCRTMGRVPFPRAMTLLRKFTIELCAPTRAIARKTIEAILVQAKDWRGHSSLESLLHDDTIESPPFGPGKYRYLLPNLAALLQQLEGPSGVATIGLDGADLSLVDLADALKPEIACKVFMRGACLSGARLPDPGTLSYIHLSLDNALIDGAAADYCFKNGLAAKSRFNAKIETEFVLIPGGTYEIRTSGGTLIEVRVGPYLIQRYPVTNRQFKAFLDAYPEWGPNEVRRKSQNDYYLGYWPLSSGSDVFSNDSWLDRPVVQINWRAAAAYAAAAGLRLPTEVEWQIAACRGAATPGNLRPWGPTLKFNNKITVISPSEEERNDPGLGRRVPTVNVLEEDANVPGFAEWRASLKMDVPSYMIGLVREWVMDVWRQEFPCIDPTSGLDSPVNLVTHVKGQLGSNIVATGVLTPPRVLCGGGFNSPEEHLTAQYRAPHRSLNVNPDVGFRCVRPIRLVSNSPRTR